MSIELGVKIKDLWEMVDLKENWDSYGADAIDERVVRFCDHVIRLVYMSYHELPYDIAPLANGGISLEYRKDERIVQCDIDTQLGIGYLRIHFDENSKRVYDGEVHWEHPYLVDMFMQIEWCLKENIFSADDE